jgi:hypothetical protein
LVKEWLSDCASPQEEDLEAAKDTAINLPELLRRQSVQHFQASPQEIRTERKSDQDFDKLNDQFGSGHLLPLEHRSGALSKLPMLTCQSVKMQAWPLAIECPRRS